MSCPSSLEHPITIDGVTYRHISLAAMAASYPDLRRLPQVLKILAENTLRRAPEEIGVYLDWMTNGGHSQREIQFWPTRVLTHDSTCVPAFVDFAAMRDAAAQAGLDPLVIRPSIPVDVVIDHSVTVDRAGTPDSLLFNMEKELARNRERYELIRWAGDNLGNVTVTPPGYGIAHQVNIERLATVVRVEQAADGGPSWLTPDTLVGSDSHTPMVSGLSVLAWGVGGVDMQMAALGKPLPMRLPSVVGVRLDGRMTAGVTAADLAYTLVDVLRHHDVVDQILEFFGPGVASLSLTDRATVANMSPEYGSTTSYFPVDDGTIDYLRLTGRTSTQLGIVEAYAKAQGLWSAPQVELAYTRVIDVDLYMIATTLAGPRNPAERVALGAVPDSVSVAIARLRQGDVAAAPKDGDLPGDGAILIAAITSCTTTANPRLMAGAGLVARKARQRGLSVPWWVKTSLSPGSRPTASYLASSGVQVDLDALGFHVTGFGCMTCIGNSGDLDERVNTSLASQGLLGSAVLSGNRNFEGRIHPHVKMAYLASPGLVVAYALAGTLQRNLETEPLGIGHDGVPVFLADIWPTQQEIDAILAPVYGPYLFARADDDNREGHSLWDTVANGTSAMHFPWSPSSTYLRRPPYLDGMTMATPSATNIMGARALLVLGDRVSTDHISPAGTIAEAGTAGEYLRAQKVKKVDFNQFSTRRGNHEVMLRGAFSNTGLENDLLAGDACEGGYTRVQPDGQLLRIYDAAMHYRDRQVPLVIVAGKEYGTGSSRDWAAKATALLGVKAVIAESFERIHRSNLISMGVLPLTFSASHSRHDLALDGTEHLDILGLDDELAPGSEVTLRVIAADGATRTFPLIVKVDTQAALESVRHGGVLLQTLRELHAATRAAQ